VSDQEKKGGLVVSDRPQISVELEDGYITISTASISEGFDSVDLEQITFPADCGEDIAHAILKLVK
jgi:hypothetical protein